MNAEDNKYEDDIRISPAPSSRNTSENGRI
jgi:hypothetical protein